ncbi:hypothetical protein [Jeotgalibacillus proteolyticus]|uniref:Uncharacterized protein n=1 Tax=Jeotgalibacillus proteolyticus TaxID=2082395 RepID=A0A2S5G7Y8_9BACL|nr:hypothetical protein [Jeotgalibacillus proteolyticus]PPA69099.1 hypothetical protein C4B60_17460 [Jeotgalibacillus proteolyticus]
MKKINRNDFKVAYDMIFVQLGWAAWMISIALVVYIGLRYFLGTDGIGSGFFSFIENPYKIFMLVVGILSVPSFLSYYVKLGVTRKHYFTGAALSSAALSLIFMIIAVIITGVEQIIAATDVETFLGVNTSWMLIFFVFSLNIFIYYAAGWLIGAGYYRFGGWGLTFSISGALLLIFMMDLLWSGELNTPLHRVLSISAPENLSLILSFGGSFLLGGLAVWGIHRMTKRVRVKL